MGKKRYTPEKIINKLREAEILLSQNETITVISKKIGVNTHTYYRWRKEYGGIVVKYFLSHSDSFQSFTDSIIIYDPFNLCIRLIYE